MKCGRTVTSADEICPKKASTLISIKELLAALCLGSQIDVTAPVRPRSPIARRWSR